MKDLIFLPIDIDLSSIKSLDAVEGLPTEEFNHYWNATNMNSDTIWEMGFDKIIKQLPFNRIRNLQYKTQRKEVIPHLDVHTTMLFEPGELDHIKETEPAGYRFVLNGQVDSLEVFNGQEWITATVPTVPCCYLINSTRALHRVKEDKDRKTVYIRGYLDPDKHAALIARSWNKYNEYAIKSVSVL